ncbi:hypothetical protein [Mycobacterium szulgai]|uniref:hypothetical protein n=1 Tax=Mycobacterium szulgai TaxID=1787 RepID=UPI0021F347B8|nr:hypothetical protein [Mycobacterium szulgai]MCV7078780.1 hypothetical protein [Mycobacterium szulgai]
MAGSGGKGGTGGNGVLIGDGGNGGKGGTGPLAGAVAPAARRAAARLGRVDVAGG